MAFETIRVHGDARGVATVTLARPAKHNAMNALMIAELTAAAQDVAQDGAVRVVILTGEGPSFCAGGDLGWMREQAGKDRAGRIAEAGALAAMLGLWNALPKPVIGRIHGAAYGGGLGLVAVCDVAVADETTRFALTEPRLGLIPATIGPFVLRKLGEGFARQVFFNAKPFDADFLFRAGALARVCAADMLDQAVDQEVAAYLACAPGAVRDAKALCLSLGGADPATAAVRTAQALAARWETDEAREGIDAFFAKRPPSWKPVD